MKTNRTPALLLAVCASALAFSASAQVGIGTTTPHSSAKLEVAATDKGFLPPRVALTGTDDAATVSSPATGLLVYNSATAGASGKEVTPGLYTWNGSVWERLSANNPNGQDIGYIVGWGSTATPPDYLLPLSGGTFNWGDYPDFKTLHTDFPSAFVASSTATTFTLANLNTDGRFLRGSSTPGVNQAMATAAPTTTAFTAASSGAHTHDVDPAAATSTSNGDHSHWTDPASVWTSSNGDHAHYSTFYNDDYNGVGGSGGSLENDGGGGYAYWTSTAGNHNHTVDIPSTQSSTNGAHTHTVDVANTTSTSNGAHTHTITGGDAETRPINTSVVWCLKVKSTSTSGAISVNSGATSATNGLTLSNNAVELGGTLTKTTTIQSGGNALILGGSAQLGVGKTPSQAVDVNGNIAASGNVSADGNIIATGTIRSSAAGSILNTVVLNESDLSFSSNLSISSTETNIFSYNYTPVSNNSLVLVEFDGNYLVGGTTGSGTDEFTSRLKISGTTVQSKTQTWGSGGAGDSRSPSLLPIMGKANNSGTSALTISVTMVRTVGDDSVLVYPDLLLKITEIAR